MTENTENPANTRNSLIKRRKNIVEEILATERSYVSHLQTVVEVFMLPLKTDEQWKSLITDDVFKTIFSDIEVILRYNSVFLDSFEKRIQSEAWDPETTKLGDIFINIADYLKVYTRYVNNYNDSHMTLKRICEEHEDFAEYLWSKRNNPRCEMKELSDFLIMPVQRIPRYNLLLADLVKNTPNDHPDFGDLIKAKERINEIAKFVNEQKRIVENLAKVGEIISSITGLDVKFKLLSPTRRFVREGELTQMQMDGEKKLFYFFLFNDLLIWTVNKKKTFKFKKLVYISDMDIRQGKMDGKVAVNLAFEDTSVLLFDKSEDVTSGWIADLISHRAEILEKQSFVTVEKRKTFVHAELFKTIQQVADTSTDLSEDGKAFKKPVTRFLTLTRKSKKELLNSKKEEEEKDRRSRSRSSSQEDLSPFVPPNKSNQGQPPPSVSMDELVKRARGITSQPKLNQSGEKSASPVSKGVSFSDQKSPSNTSNPSFAKDSPGANKDKPKGFNKLGVFKKDKDDEFKISAPVLVASSKEASAHKVSESKVTPVSRESLTPKPLILPPVPNLGQKRVSPTSALPAINPPLRNAPPPPVNQKPLPPPPSAKPPPPPVKPKHLSSGSQSPVNPSSPSTTGNPSVQANPPSISSVQARISALTRANTSANMPTVPKERTSQTLPNTTEPPPQKPRSNSVTTR